MTNAEVVAAFDIAWDAVLAHLDALTGDRAALAEQVALQAAAIALLQAEVARLTAPPAPAPAPTPPPPPPGPSADGTRVPPAESIIDATGARWTLAGQVYRDGVSMGWGTCQALKLVSSNMWVQGDSGTWYLINGTTLGYSQPNEPGDPPAPPPAPTPAPPPAPTPAPPPPPADPPPPAPAPPPPTGSPNDLSTLLPGFARNLGSWMEAPGSTDPNEMNVQAPNQRTDWGSMCYSAKHDALFMQGGHHGLHLTTAPRKLQPHLGVYRNIAPTVPIAEMTVANCDSTQGRWVSHNAPWSRHTFQSMVAVGDYVGCLLGQNSHNPVNGIVPPPGDGKPYFWNLNDPNPLTACEFVLTASGWHSHWMGAVGISGRYAVACYVPESNWLQCWVYDHQTKSKRQVPMQIDTVGWPGAINVCFDGTACYAVGPFGKVFKLLIDPATATGTCEQLSAGWAPLAGDSDVRVDYDRVNHALGGCLKNGTYRSFDLATRTWSEVTVQVEAGSTGVPHQSFWASAFDTTRGIYYAANNAGQLWAYRPLTSVAPAPTAPDTPDSTSRLVLSDGNDGPNARVCNTAFQTAWLQVGGDWFDADGVVNGPNRAQTAVSAADGAAVQLDVTAQVRALRAENNGLMVRRLSGMAREFCSSRASGDRGPKLTVVTAAGPVDCPPLFDFYLSTSSDRPVKTNSLGSEPVVKFDLTGVVGAILSASLRLTVAGIYGAGGDTMLVVSPVAMPRIVVDPALKGTPAPGIATGLTLAQLKAHPAVIAYDDLTSDALFLGPAAQYLTTTLGVGGHEYLFLPEFGVSALRVWSGNSPHVLDAHKWAQPVDSLPAPGAAWKRPYVAGAEAGHTHVFFSYVLRIGEDVLDSMTEQGMKLPTVAGTYNWSQSGAVTLPEPGSAQRGPGFEGAGGGDDMGTFDYRTWHTRQSPANPHLYRLCLYSYDAEHPIRTNPSNGEPRYSDGYLEAGRLHEIELEVKLNTIAADGTPQSDGITRMWIDGHMVYERTNVKVRGYRDVNIQTLCKLEIYHGGMGVPKAGTRFHYDVANPVVASQRIGTRRRFA